jgi:hypothetical protein
VMVEAARLLGHEPDHIKWLENREVLQLPDCRLMPPLPAHAEAVSGARLATADGVGASARSLLAVGGLVFDVAAGCSSDAASALLGFESHQLAGYYKPIAELIDPRSLNA